MKRIVLLFICCCLLCGCAVRAESAVDEPFTDDAYFVSQVEFVAEAAKTGELRGMWVSQFDLHPILRDGGKQRDKQEYTEMVRKMILNLKESGFNSIFLQLRPNGDSMYESEIYPMSKYIAGVYGGKTEYDAIEIFVDLAKEASIEVHGWINPFRLCKEEELVNYGMGILYEWYKEGLGKRIEKGDDGILYLDPAYTETTDLIVAGAEEILKKYDLAGIHLDDYFYPTEFEFNDKAEYEASGYDDLGDFRRANINRTVSALYNAAHKADKLFGVAPAGNIYSLQEGWYVDIYNWCGSKGYVDYIMPQLYFGFKNKACPFDKVLKDWEKAVEDSGVKLYIGLSAAKCALGSDGVADAYAGEDGKYEWRDRKDILKTSVELLRKNEVAEGFCVFTYTSVFDPVSGEANPSTAEEMTALLPLILSTES